MSLKAWEGGILLALLEQEGFYTQLLHLVSRSLVRLGN